VTEEEIEDASLQAWPAFDEVRVGPWLVRSGNGYTKRANSATLTVFARSLDPAPGIQECAERYRARGLRPCFRLPSFTTPPRVDALLEEDGYDRVDATQVLALDLHATDLPDVAPVAARDLLSWTAAHSRLSGRSPAQVEQYRELLETIRPPHVRACLTHEEDDDEEDAVACGLGILVDDSFGLFDLITAPEHRNRGLGRQLVHGMLAWARTNGARSAYLQVVEANTAARRLYERLGFKPSYRYWYRLQPLPEARPARVP
jgi:N-acetylglutamate synthase